MLGTPVVGAVVAADWVDRFDDRGDTFRDGACLGLQFPLAGTCAASSSACALAAR